MNLEGLQWVVGIVLLPLIWKVYDILNTRIQANHDTTRGILKDLWDAQHKHEDQDSKFHLDIVQNVIPNAVRDLAARMDARFDRLEDKIEKERKT